MTNVSLEQAASQLDQLVDAALAGHDVVLNRNGRGVRLVPVESAAVASVTSQAWSDLMKDFAGKAQGLPSDMAENHDHYLHRAAKK